jgi:hypothetical protein
MAELVLGVKALHDRLNALNATHDTSFMSRLALSAVAEEKRLVPRRTGNLGRSIHVGRITPTYAEAVADANYAAYVEFGTAPHDIRPSRKKVLRFQNSAGEAVFAKIVHHPGTRAQPFMVPGAQRAIRIMGLADLIVARWNKAA